jgi:hypothetical protein
MVQSGTDLHLLLLSKAIYAPIYIANDTLPIVVIYMDIFLMSTGGATCRTCAKMVIWYQWLYIATFRVLLIVRMVDDSRGAVQCTPSPPGAGEEDYRCSNQMVIFEKTAYRLNFSACSVSPSFL